MTFIAFITKTTSGTLFPIPPSHLKSFGLDAITIDDSLAKSVQWQKKKLWQPKTRLPHLLDIEEILS